jgi:hypothetical protein
MFGGPTNSRLGFPNLPFNIPYLWTQGWCLELGVFSWMETTQFWQESDATLAPL